MFLMGIFWYHLYDMSNYKLCNLDTYNHNFGSSVELFHTPLHTFHTFPHYTTQRAKAYAANLQHLNQHAHLLAHHLTYIKRKPQALQQAST